MAKMVLLITAEPDKWYDVAEAWQKVGAPGVTIIDSHGLRRIQERRGHAEVLPGVFSMATILRQLEQSSRIILSVVEADMVNVLISEVRKIFGDLSEPDNGIVFTIDVGEIIGLRHPQK